MEGLDMFCSNLDYCSHSPYRCSKDAAEVAVDMEVRVAVDVVVIMVVGVGEVEQILLMKPKAQGPHDEGFLEYLEDIIGTNKYVFSCTVRFNRLEAAVPTIIEETQEFFFKKTINMLKQTLDICYNKNKEIRCLSFPQKPEGSMAFMVKLNVSLLKDISDDIDFCFKLAKEDFVIILPASGDDGQELW